MTPTEGLDIPVNIVDDDPPYDFDLNNDTLGNNDEYVASQTDNELPSAERSAPTSANQMPSDWVWEQLHSAFSSKPKNPNPGKVFQI